MYRLRLLIPILVSCLLVSCSGSQHSQYSGDLVTQELSDDVTPINYKLAISPDLKVNHFSGSEIILLKVNKETSEIVLNSKALTIDKAELTEPTADAKVTDMPEVQRLRLVFSRPLKPGVASLHITFHGHMNNRFDGFFCSSYSGFDKQIEKLTACLFEPTGARTMFPCFDQPSMKATFELSTTVEKNLDCISNSPIQSISEDKASSTKVVAFAPTGKLSTYQLQLVIGKLESEDAISKNGMTVRVWTRRGIAKLGRTSRDAVLPFLEYYADYLAMKSPWKKLDIIAMPVYSEGAMESPGAIIFGQSNVLIDPATSSVFRRQLVLQSLAHELAHTWFGNLVTPKSWNDLWLNESFATWMSIKAVNHLRPDWHFTDFYSLWRQHILDTDSQSSLAPLSLKTLNSDHPTEVFSLTSYTKGSSLISMIESAQGEKEFQKGIRAYIKQYAWGNTSPDDLWHSLGQLDNKPIADLMNGWIQQSGFPLISVVKTKDGYTGTQSPFSYGFQTNAEAVSWVVPATIQWLTEYQTDPQSKSGSNASTKPSLVVSDDHGAINVNVNRPGKDLPYLNQSGFGYFRLSYAQGANQTITKRIGQLNACTKTALLGDRFALAVAGKGNFDDYFDSLDNALASADPLLTRAATLQFTYLASIVDNQDLSKILADYLRPKYKLLWQKYSKLPDSDLKTELKASLFAGLSAGLDDPLAKADAVRQFALYRDQGVQIAPDYRDGVLHSIAYWGDVDSFRSVDKCLIAETSPEVRDDLVRALALFRQQETIDLLLTGTLRKTSMLRGVIQQFSQLAANQKAQMPLWQFIVKYRHEGVIGQLNEFDLIALLTETATISSRECENSLPALIASLSLKPSDPYVKSALEVMRNRAIMRSEVDKSLPQCLARRLAKLKEGEKS